MNGNAASAQIAFVLIFACFTFGSGVLLRKPVPVDTGRIQEKAKRSVVQAPSTSKNVTGLPVNATKITEDPLAAELKNAEDQVRWKDKELKLQAGLEKEKEAAATKALKNAATLRGRAEQLAKEAVVAAQIAKEKSLASAKAEGFRNATELKAQHLLSEQHEMQRVLNQTKEEEIQLQRNVTRIQQLIQAEAKKHKGVKQIAKESNTSRVAKAAVLAATSTANVTKVHAQSLNSGTASIAANVSNINGTGSSISQAMKKLIEENNLLKHETAVLKDQLQKRKVATDKAILKQKLKNRLALADRHMKLRKTTLSAH